MKELEPLIQREEQKEKKHKKLEQIKKYLKIYEKKFHFLLLILLLNVNLDLIFYHKKSQLYLKSDIFSGPSPGYNALFSSLLFSSLLFSSLLFSSLTEGRGDKKENKRREGRKRAKIYKNLIKYIILINLVIKTLQSNHLNSRFINFSKITLKINGIGTKNIFSSSFNSNNYPKEVYINGNKTNTVTPSNYLNQDNNIIELIWNNDINDCQCMFYSCSDIIEIDLSEFYTSQVTHMGWMFYGCSSLTSINLNNFDTSKVASMYGMFCGCSSLTSLNLSHFDTSQVKKMPWMFSRCNNLEYINLKNFNEISLGTDPYYYQKIFNNVPDNIVICISESNSKILSELEAKCYTIDCSDDWKSKQKKIISKTGNCIDKCENDAQYKYEYNGKCYDECSKGYLTDDNNNTIYKCELNKCLTCTPVSLKYNLCTKCNIDYYYIEDDPTNICEYINCYKEFPNKGYYLDKDEQMYKKCYYTCETCEIKGDNITHNCLECNIQIVMRTVDIIIILIMKIIIIVQ